MVRNSRRKHLIMEFEKIVLQRRRLRDIRYLMNWKDEWEDFVDEWYEVKVLTMKKTRYLCRPQTYRKRDIYSGSILPFNRLNDSEFIHHFRMPRFSFHHLLNLINNYEQNEDSYQQIGQLELLCCLKFLGVYGNGGSLLSLKYFFGIGYGTADKYIKKGISAIIRMKANVISWPDDEERRIISQVYKNTYILPHCIGVIDGTIFPLSYKPEKNGEDYFTRKSNYGIQSLVVCDNDSRIREITMGWPGSVHDNRSWKNSKMFLRKNDYFDNQQYLIGDCAFTQSDTMIPVYKQPFGGRLSPLKEKFNSVLAKGGGRSEHCFGLLKGRFQYLKGIRVRLKGRKDMIKINRIITASAILHNLLIASAYDEAWIEIDSEEEVIGDDNIPCDQRRDQLLNYIREQLY